LKTRADLLLVSRKLAPSRAQAQALLLAGRVYWGEQRVDKAGTLLPETAELTVRPGAEFVSRGGHKLDGALRDLELDVTGAVAADLGASTGGFTDCLLKRGAARVYAVDVGFGLLDPKLVQDPRVVVMDRTNARTLTTASFPEPLDLVVVDASFIGLGKLMPAIAELLAPEKRLVALVKPQFEVGKERAARDRGVVRDPAVREAAIEQARRAIREAGFRVEGECDSSVRGPKGNLERFVRAVRA
jgi:23S rRNA (cytidine1920-2'-O)/16S rRNA (cytidine1409-2'-O)-methyltransferase